jgi:serpin B
MSEEQDEGRLADPTHSTLRVPTRRTRVTVGWRAADTARRTVLMRRRRRWGIGAGAVLLAAAVVALSLTSGSGGTTPQASVHTADRLGGAVQLVADAAPFTAADPSAVDRVAAAEQALSVALLQRLGAAPNTAVSPTSLYLALGMLQNAARGETAAQISKALQASGLAASDQNAGLAGLMRQLAGAAKKDGITLDSANSLWQQRGFAVRKQFLSTLAKYYGTGVWQVDFAGDNAGALRAIDDWTRRQTHGKIEKLFDQLDRSTVLVLANAIYFHAAWATPFDKNLTTDGTFTTADGTAVQVKYMSGLAGLQTVTTADYQAVQVPYQGGRFAALAVMPASGSLADFVSALTPQKISGLHLAGGSGCTVELPRFTTTARVDLAPVLRALGMTTAFTDSADLSGLSAQPTEVDQVIQRVYLGVGEKGTTAAAATGISIRPTGAGVGCSMRFDHPFLFLVRDTTTGAILFAAQVHDPTAG